MFRIKQYPEGWIVEMKVGVFQKWKHVTHWSGIDEPYYYKTPEDALDGALREIREKILFSF